MNVLEESFGHRQVTPQERRMLIRAVFSAVAPRYDLMNDLMSWGIHRLWKRRLARRCEAVRGRIVDLAGGTGDVARLLVRSDREVIVVDPSLMMMKAGLAKARRPSPNAWLAGEAEALPLATESVDLLAIAFGIRNVTRLDAALSEIQRVLRPGGHFVCLEFSRPAKWLAPFYDLYSWLVIPALGAIVARAPIAYRYLVESIRRFPDQREFARILTEAGFVDVSWENCSFGIASLHFARKSH
ncbi:MAG: class I SAM-dependent methyltransferase [Rhodocyclaceae bacterium]|nr:class I SAM-dependent methyltransferase [Rhodocyclaceae bacterium]